MGKGPHKLMKPIGIDGVGQRMKQRFQYYKAKKIKPSENIQ
jgi:hypothetical protein